MTAIRLARAATGREQVLKFAGAYHGHVDGLLAQAGSGLATQALPASPGVPASAAAGTVVVPWNDPDALRAADASATSSRRSSPSRCRRTWASSRRAPGFLELLRERADANGALLVLDEVISGFRVARGGAQELIGVSGDLTIMGKIIGGGLPAAAVGGRARADADARARRATSTRRGRCRATRSRWPPAWPRSSCSTSPPTCAWPRSPSGSPTGLREAAAGRAYPVAGGERAGPADGVLQRPAGASLRRCAGAATSTRTRRGAASCSRAACTRRRRSSRRGSPRSRTRRSRSSARSRRAAAAFARLREPEARR